jgi:hypothetical protein
VARIAAVKVGPTGVVAGVDLNPGMLNVAGSLKTPDDAASVQWQEASADRLPFPNGSFDIQIRSPFALIAVRGTRVFAGPSNGPFGIFVERGVVTVTGGGQQVVLHSGEGTDFFTPGSAPTPVKRWQPPHIRAALASVS